jgi:NAD(P)H dehydrogenase (quinone)
MTTVVTGATGKLGRRVVEALLRQGVAPDQIVATGRAVERLGDLAATGVAVRRADFDDPDSLRSAFAGARKLLLVSGSEVGSRVRQHRDAIEAAQAAGVQHIAYTSLANADRSSVVLAPDHRATEQAVVASGIPFTILRNSWYLELYTDQLTTYLGTGVVLGAAGDGRVSAANRDDYARAAAAVLTGDEHAGKVYELGGDESFTLLELAEEISRQSEKTVVYQDLPTAEYQRALEGFGLPAPAAALYADCDRAIAAGELVVDGHDLSRLIGRPTTSMPEAIAAALAA